MSPSGYHLIDWIGCRNSVGELMALGREACDPFKVIETRRSEKSGQLLNDEVLKSTTESEFAIGKLVPLRDKCLSIVRWLARNHPTVRVHTLFDIGQLLAQNHQPSFVTTGMQA